MKFGTLFDISLLLSLNKYAAKLYKHFPPQQNNVSTLTCKVKLKMLTAHEMYKTYT